MQRQLTFCGAWPASLANDECSDLAAIQLGLDIVLAEGYHREAKPKIEIRSIDHHKSLCASDEKLLAVVEEEPSVEAVPSFTPSSTKSLADLIVRKVLNRG